MAEVTNDDAVKRMELEAQRQPPQNGEDTTAKGLQVEAAAIQVLDNCPQQAEERVIIHRYIVPSPTPSVRSDTAVQCCYPVSARPHSVCTIGTCYDVRVYDMGILLLYAYANHRFFLFFFLHSFFRSSMDHT